MRKDSNLTIERILDAAQLVLVTNGGIGFTMRLVAQSAGISPGNLTYHFPSKNGLLRALISRLVETYSEQLASILSDLESSVDQQVESLVRWVVMDNVDEITVRISRELWAMALHDELIREAIDDFYDELMERLINMLHRSRPTVDKVAIMEMVHLLVLLAEGTAVLFGTRRKRAVSVERMIEVTTQIFRSIEPNVDNSNN